MKLGLLNKDFSFVLRWDYNRNSLYQKPIFAGLGDSWLSGIGTETSDKLYRRIRNWFSTNTTGSEYIHFASKGWHTGELTPDFISDTYRARHSEPSMNVSRVCKRGANIILVWLGANDFTVWGNPKERWVDNLISMKEEADKYGVEIFFTTSRPSDSWTTAQSRADVQWVASRIRTLFPNNYIELLNSFLKTTKGANDIAFNDASYGSLTLADEPNAAATALLFDMWLQKMTEYFVDKNIYQSYDVEHSTDNGTTWNVVFPDLSPSTVHLELPYENNLGKYRVRAKKLDNSYTDYTSIVEPQVPNKVLWNTTTALRTNSAKVGGRILYKPPVLSVSSEPKIYTLIFDGSHFAMYVNGELISNVPKTGNFRFLGNIFIGADYDDTQHFKGVLPNIIFWDKVLNTTDITANINWLADKWLPTGKILPTGHTVAATAGVKPTLSTAGAGAFLEFDELGLQLSRSNLLLRTSEFENASWTKTGLTVSANQINDPLGNVLIADKFIESLGGTNHYLSQAVNISQATEYTLSIYAKSGERNVLVVSPTETGSANYPTKFDLLNGTVISGSTGNTNTIESLGNGWYRCSVMRKTINTQTSLTCRFGPNDGVSASFSYAGDGASGLYIFGAQLELGGITDYIPNTSSIVAVTETRVRNWLDNSVLGTQRNAAAKTGTSIGVKSIKGKNAAYFDNQTVMKVAGMDTPPNSPNVVTIMWVAEFDNYDKSYEEMEGQTLLGANGNSAIRVKKFNNTEIFNIRIGTDLSSYTTIEIPRNKVLEVEDLSQIKVGVVRIKVSIFENLVNASISNEIQISAADYGAFQTSFNGLLPNTKYYGIVEVDGQDNQESKFEFKTLKSGTNSFKFLLGSCNKSASLARTWDQMLTENADMMFHLGDLNYENVDSGNIEDYVVANKLTFDSPKIKKFFRKQAMMYIPDNHDSLNPSPIATNPNWPIWKKFQKIMLPNYSSQAVNEVQTGLYFNIDVGRIRLIVIDTRRNRKHAADVDDENKTMLGAEQKQWLKDKLLEVKNHPFLEQTIIFSSVLYLAVKGDPKGHSYNSAGPSWGSYATERKEIANFIHDSGIKNVSWACTDSHMQAIDDGRNSVYATDTNGNRRDWKTIAPEFLQPVLEASPLERFPELQGGPFQISDIEYSGGPFQEYYSYGVIEVMDRGENWIQTTFKIKAYNRSQDIWYDLVSYKFNSPARGVPGTPPPITEDEELAINGYVGENFEWKKVLQRYIGVQGEYKPVQHKFVGKAGAWRLVYADERSSKHDSIYVTHANAYTVNHNNVVYIYGKDLFGVKYPRPKIGGFWSFENRLTDSFDNFTALNQVGSGLIYQSRDGLVGLASTNQSSWAESDPIAAGGFNAASFGGYRGDLSFFVGLQFFVEPDVLQDSGQPIWLWYSGSIGTHIGLSIVPSGENIGKLVLVMTRGGVTMNWEATGFEVVPNIWTRVGINWFSLDPTPISKMYIRTGVDTIYPSIDDFQEISLNVTPITWVGDPVDKVYIGAGPDLSSQITSTRGITLRNFHLRGDILSELNVVKALSDAKVGIVLYDENDIEIAQLAGPDQRKENLLRFLDNSISFLTPKGLDGSKGFIRVVNGEQRSVRLPFKINGVTKREQPLILDFKNIDNLLEHLYIREGAWGGANGGVVSENVRLENGELVLRANGDLYSGNVQGVDRDGNKKFHTYPNDPNFGKPWVTRVGAVVQTKENLGYGSYTVMAKLPRFVGACSAIWTFHYEEAYPGSSLYDEIIGDGITPIGNDTDGYYVVRNHEIDIEFPSHIGNQPSNQPSYNNAKMNTWVSENKAEINLTALGRNLADNAYHELRFDWHNDRVEFYIDGILMQTNTENIPDIPGPFVFGIWFPSSNANSPARPNWNNTSPWKPNPDLTWAGTANWEVQELRISSVTFTPYDEPGERLIGETYPFGGTRYFGNGTKIEITDPLPPNYPVVQLKVDTKGLEIWGIIRIYDEYDVLVDTKIFDPAIITQTTIKQPNTWRVELDLSSAETTNKRVEFYVVGQFIKSYQAKSGETSPNLAIPETGFESRTGNITITVIV